MAFNSSTGEPVKEPELTPNELRKSAGLPPLQSVSKPSKGPVVILSILLMFICLVSAYLFATAETGICHDSIIQARIDQANSMANTTLVDTKAFDKGYAKGIADTQNATLLLGYCSAQQEFVTNGALIMNNTTLVAPVTLLKEICFR